MNTFSQQRRVILELRADMPMYDLFVGRLRPNIEALLENYHKQMLYVGLIPMSNKDWPLVRMNFNNSASWICLWYGTPFFS